MGQRVRFFDTVRGFSVLSMVAFHLCYDLRYIAGLSLPWFQGTAQDVWRASISWVFLAIAGIMGSFSRNNYRRAAKYGLFALAIYVVTRLAAVDDAISFGIIFCMAACTLVAAVLCSAKAQPRGPVAAVVCLLAFLALLRISSGYLELGLAKVELPRELYATPWLSWLGFPGPHFVSGDYYPVLPYLLMYLAGLSMGPQLKEAFSAGRLTDHGLRPLEWVGRHALLVYAVHQPVLLAVASVLAGTSFF